MGANKCAEEAQQRGKWHNAQTQARNNVVPFTPRTHSRKQQAARKRSIWAHNYAKKQIKLKGVQVEGEPKEKPKVHNMSICSDIDSDTMLPPVQHTKQTRTNLHLVKVLEQARESLEHATNATCQAMVSTSNKLC
jgi:hypothetical protein